MHDNGFAVEVLDEMPDDGRRYELIDGALIVTPAPPREDQRSCIALAMSIEHVRRPHYELVDGALIVTPSPQWEHQLAANEITARLREAAPVDVYVFGASMDVTTDSGTGVEPDVCVVRRSDLVPDEPYRGVPVLVVEVLSPSSDGIDRLLKRHVYASMGVPSYWIVDLADPSITVLDLVDDDYAERMTVHGDDVLSVDLPFPVTACPSELILA